MLKVITKEEVVKFIPAAEKDDPKPTTICFKPMTKRDFDRYIDSMTETKRNKTSFNTGRSGEFLYRACLASDEKGVFIYNALIDGVPHEEINDKEQAIEFLLGLRDVETANEIERAMRGQSELSEAEIKN